MDTELFSTHLKWMTQGTTLFGEGLLLLDPEEHERPSLLESWSVSHLIAHVNSNARALVNLTVWASTGIENPMYQSNEKRATDIDEGAKQPLTRLMDDFHVSSREFYDGITALSTGQLDFKVKSARGRDIPVSDAVWIRIREVWIHAVDLAVDIGFSQFPATLLDALMDDVVSGFSVRENHPNLELVAKDVSRTWNLGTPDLAVVVEGSEHAILGWLLGRGDGSNLNFGTPQGLAPILPAWL